MSQTYAIKRRQSRRGGRPQNDDKIAEHAYRPFAGRCGNEEQSGISERRIASTIV
ncbi:hypothetical protein [Agrobacterium deltaense]|uniref:hypothetical protein n=1 Tax=Agrobacterium deltaense TaxID=1183412 RepID=UPI001C6EABE9|nr:hypothetical protein [Agrobacterium deltaense]MBW9075678.1 hypothetical protein [Agrobacterium deltaense]